MLRILLLSMDKMLDVLELSIPYVDTEYRIASNKKLKGFIQNEKSKNIIIEGKANSFELYVHDFYIFRGLDLIIDSNKGKLRLRANTFHYDISKVIKNWLTIERNYLADIRLNEEIVLPSDYNLLDHLGELSYRRRITLVIFDGKTPIIFKNDKGDYLVCCFAPPSKQ